ncbi:sulfate transporter subunit [Paenibacillus sp. CAA11]|uniref:sulfate ABC transporter substrate-binding protein n=1 Tax=Paenibacillus sp. CAA11 TaxID=1532905 RepID=UPI000D3BF061|nr:sulfate ABC transporter substrate-binding protein [Paenibacillus sp. CAA11]AWB46762.1 sulfate transporter subunit [Paenibacillus sp. CAA11]
MTMAACSAEDGGAAAKGRRGETSLLNVSYDTTRELYEEYNRVFAVYWEKKTGQKVSITQSHGGSGKQSRSVADGQEADVVSLALDYDIDALAKRGLLRPDWRVGHKLNRPPYTSVIVFLVHKGNPLGIRDWGDLIPTGAKVITPNPQTSGGARWNYIAAWSYAMHHHQNDPVKARAFMKKLYRQVPVLDTGARGATTTFAERGIGDVLITWESEALLSIQGKGRDKFEIVYPSESISAEPAVAVVDDIVDRKGTREVAEAYLDYLYSEEGQTAIAKHFFRPTLDSVKEQYKSQFRGLKLYTVGDYGGWATVEDEHFSDGGVFDQIYTPVN